MNSGRSPWVSCWTVRNPKWSLSTILQRKWVWVIIIKIIFMNPILMNDGLQSLCSDLIKISFEYPSLPPVLGGELLVDLRAALLCGCLFGGCQELVPSGRGDNKLSVARKPHKGQVCDSGGQQSGFGKGSCNYDRRWVWFCLFVGCMKRREIKKGRK